MIGPVTIGACLVAGGSVMLVVMLLPGTGLLVRDPGSLVVVSKGVLALSGHDRGKNVVLRRLAGIVGGR